MKRSHSKKVFLAKDSPSLKYSKKAQAASIIVCCPNSQVARSPRNLVVSATNVQVIIGDAFVGEDNSPPGPVHCAFIDTFQKQK